MISFFPGKILIGLFWFVCSATLPAAPVEPSPELLFRYEPQLYFLLGLSAIKEPGKWEVFGKNEKTAEESYTKIARFLAEKFGYANGRDSRDDAQAEKQWREAFGAFMDRYFKYFNISEWGGMMDHDIIISNARRKASVHAYLAGAYLRQERDGRLRHPRYVNAMIIAMLINRQIDTGVLCSHSIGTIPGGMFLEYNETPVLRKIFDSWKQIVKNPEGITAFHGMEPKEAGCYDIDITYNEEISKEARNNIRQALSYELEWRGEGHVLISSHNADELWMRIVVYDFSAAKEIVRRVLIDYGIPQGSVILRQTPTAEQGDGSSRERQKGAGRVLQQNP